MRIDPSELFKLTWGDVDFYRRTIRVFSARKNLDMPWRDIPIKDSLLPVMAIWHMDDKKIGADHIIHYKGKPVNSIKTGWRKAKLRAGVRKEVRPYDLRHAFTTEALGQGADLRTIAELMSHSDLQMVMKHYLHSSNPKKREAIAALPDLPEAIYDLCVQPMCTDGKGVTD